VQKTVENTPRAPILLVEDDSYEYAGDDYT
jgi:hypothetical protein